MAVVVRKVWQSNLDAEFRVIAGCLKQFRFASMDTEFPGTIYKPEGSVSTLSAAHVYALMKKNVDALNIIQLGLTLSDDRGNLPTLGTPATFYVWEFNFRDFDCDYDRYNPESIAFLREQGINFAEHKRRGINSRFFAAYFLRSGLGMGRAWVTFHGLYDLGFLIKILTRAPLPGHLPEFMLLLRRYLGIQVYDLKPITRSFALHGGLDAVSRSLSVQRAAGKSHHAGSDSLLTMQVFARLVLNSNYASASAMLRQFNYLLYGLTC
ncbi:probable CCR4-associated factor 1 homolog 11 [Salvia hispanica]|uniref:probable CCR4-associated factor 1 homolog 11 n=1 Tax=Salvia hispanica TaxID=49212 RepID=UPI0020096920|nr:probable CCR4-associated factor 1 homolog 11 [Salvia hispanica]